MTKCETIKKNTTGQIYNWSKQWANSNQPDPLNFSFPTSDKHIQTLNECCGVNMFGSSQSSYYPGLSSYMSYKVK